jgi:hypothetical protein
MSSGRFPVRRGADAGQIVAISVRTTIRRVRLSTRNDNEDIPCAPLRPREVEPRARTSDHHDERSARYGGRSSKHMPAYPSSTARG